MRPRIHQAELVMIVLLACGTVLAQQPAPQRLTLKEAITLALKTNVSVLVAGAQVTDMEGATQRQHAALLPRVTGQSFANLQNRNLAVAGLSIPGIPTVVGPFAFFDARLAASQSVIDLRSYREWRAAQENDQAARLSYQDTRDLVIRQTAALYLDAESSLAEMQAAQSRIPTSQALAQLAQDQRSQGLATGVDVVRAQVELQRDRQTILIANDNYQTALLALERYVGMQPGTPIELAEQLQFKHVELPNLDQAIETALHARPDYRSLLSQSASLVEQQKASRARYYPTLSIGGDYGALGRNLGAMPGIGEIQVTLSITLFDRDRSGEQKQLASRVDRINDQIQDLSRGIAQEIRKAALDLESTEQQVAVTQSALDLAQQELTLSEDRFRNGVTDNIEVVTAQAALAAAQDDNIAALAQHADAQAALARALGATERNYQNYFDGSSYPSQQNGSSNP